MTSATISTQATQACRLHATSLLNLIRLQDVFYGLASATAPIHFFLFAAATVSVSRSLVCCCALPSTTADPLLGQAHTLSHPVDASSSAHASAELQTALFALGQVEATWEGARCASTLLGDFLRRMGLVQEVEVEDDEREEEEDELEDEAGGEEGGEVSPRMNEFWLA